MLLLVLLVLTHVVFNLEAVLEDDFETFNDLNDVVVLGDEEPFLFL